MSKLVIMDEPYTTGQMKEALRGASEGYITGIVPVDLSDIVEGDLESFLDLLSEKVTGTELLMDINYDVVGFEENTLFIKVTGDVSNIVEIEDGDSYDDVDEY